jgi:hypothetical protein
MFALMILVGIAVIVLLARIDSGGVRNHVPTKVVMIQTEIRETRDWGFPG